MEELLTIQQAAARHGIPEQTLYTAARQGRLQTVFPHRPWLVTAAAAAFAARWQGRGQEKEKSCCG